MNQVNIPFIAKISLVIAVRMLGLFMILPVFALLGKNYLYANELLIGIAIGIYGFTQGILQIPFGYLSDIFGRKLLIIIGLLLFAIGSFISATNDNIYWVIFGRLLAGSGAIASVIMAFITDIIPSKHQPKIFALFGLQIGAAFVLALIIGPLIANDYGLDGIFYTTGILSLVAIVITLLLPNISTTTKQYQLSFTSIKSVLTPQLINFDISIFILHFSLTSLFVIIPNFITEQIAMNYLIVFIISFMCMFPLLIIAQKYNQCKYIINIAIMLMIFSLLLFIDGYESYYLIVILVLFFTGFNLIEALIPSLVAKDIEQNHSNKRGLVMGMYTSSQFFGAFFGGIITGLILHYFNANIAFIVNVAFMAIWLIIINRRIIWQE